MARVPISFYFSILAGIIVLFNHYAAFETGDVALNKITGATRRFYALFRDTAFTIQRGCTSRLETALCGLSVESVLPDDAATHFKVRYCRLPPSTQGSESGAGVMDEHKPREGYGGSRSATVYHPPPVMGPLAPRTSAQGSLGSSPFVRGGSGQGRFSQAVWDRTGEAMKTMGMLLLRTCAAWWWFRAPLGMTGLLLATYAALSAFDHMFAPSLVMQGAFQVCMTIVADFLQCIQWESQRLVLYIGVMIMERVYEFLVHVR